jgi:hypothetical protein
MSTKPFPPHNRPTSTGRRQSMDQGRPAEKPKTSRLKRFGVFRSGKHDENKEQDVGSDNTAEKAPNDNDPTSRGELNTNPNKVRLGNH